MKKKGILKWLTVLLAAVGVATQVGLLPPVAADIAESLHPGVVAVVEAV